RNLFETPTPPHRVAGEKVLPRGRPLTQTFQSLLGLMPRIPVVLLDPGVQAPVEGIMEKVPVQAAHWPVHEVAEVDRALERDLLPAEQADHPRRIEAAVPQPASHEHGFEAYPVGRLRA